MLVGGEEPLGARVTAELVREVRTGHSRGTADGEDRAPGCDTASNSARARRQARLLTLGAHGLSRELKQKRVCLGRRGACGAACRVRRVFRRTDGARDGCQSIVDYGLE